MRGGLSDRRDGGGGGKGNCRDPHGRRESRAGVALRRLPPAIAGICRRPDARASLRAGGAAPHDYAGRTFAAVVRTEAFPLKVCTAKSQKGTKIYAVCL